MKCTDTSIIHIVLLYLLALHNVELMPFRYPIKLYSHISYYAPTIEAL